MKQLTDDQQDRILSAIKSAYALTIAKSEEGHSTCSCYHIQPFNEKWDKETVDAVAESVCRYVGTWILSPLAEIMEVDVTQIDDSLKHNQLKRELALLEVRMFEKKNGLLNK